MLVRAVRLRVLPLLFVGLLACAALLPHVVRAGKSQAQNTAETASVAGQQKSAGPRAASVPGEIIVRFRTDAATAKRSAGALTVQAVDQQIALQLESLAPADSVEPLYLAHVAATDTQAALAALNARPDVLYAEPNFVRRKLMTPNDPRYGELWGLKNTGQSGGTAGADIRAEQAWDTTTGSRAIVVAVIDEGIDVSHQDLQANVWHNPGEIPNNNLDDDGNGFIDDYNGYDFVHNDGSVYDGAANDFDTDKHGTHVAGTIGAVGNNGVGVVGVNWQTSLMSLKFLGPEGGTTADLVRALGYAKMMRDRWVSTSGAQGANIRVTNNSYGGGGYSQAEFDAISALNDAGILFVAAAGNESEDNNVVPAYPATYDLPNVISVAALDRSDNVAGFSNIGARTVHIGAPGVSILSTTPHDTYSLLSGTSMASPHVAGTAALVLAAHPDFTIARLRAALLFGGTALPSLATKTVTGRRVSAAGALQNADEADTTPPGPITDLRIAAQDEHSVTLAWTASGDDGQTGSAALHEIRFVEQATGVNIPLYVARPAAAGTAQSVSLNIPYRHAAGAFGLRVTDNVGNAANASVAVATNPPAAAEPYTITTGPATALSTGGQRLNANYDDFISQYPLPFSFPYYDRSFSAVNYSTNGVLYLAPTVTPTPRHDAGGLHEVLNSSYMIAGLWDDLDLRTCLRGDADIYVVKPDNDRVIFRWQGVRFVSSICNGPAGDPVNFEIELRRDGTIQLRYGDNPRVAPIVGLGAGEPEGYLINSHTSEAAPRSLTNAPTLNFALQTPPRQADLRVNYSAFPNPVLIGQNFTLTVTATNRGPNRATNVVVTDTMSPQAAFVSCATPQGACAGPGGPAPGGVVTFNLGTVAAGATVSANIVLTAVSYADTGFTNAVTINSATFDPTPGDNSANFYTTLLRPNPAPLTSISAVAAGSAHVLALRTDGTALAWGLNGNGQLGDGTHTLRQQPVRVSNLTNVRTLDAGATHSIALRTNGTVWTWGGNNFGQLGDGTNGEKKVPAPVDGLTNIVAVAAGGRHSLALSSDGKIWAWGDNAKGQLGDGTNNPRLRPAQISGLDNVRALAAGGNYSLALKMDGTVWAWGGNDSGQLGDGTTSSRNAPVQISGLTNVVALDASNTFPYTNVDMAYSCALKADGTVWTWGANYEGQLANGTTTNRATPAQVANLSGVTAVALGDRHGLALKSDGTVWAWGANNSGQMGDQSDRFTRHTTPTQVLWLSNVSAIAAGDDFSLALRQDGHLLAWGVNFSGQLGGNGTTERNFPYEVNDKVPDPPPLGTVALPAFDPPGGVYNGAQNVTIRSATNDATVRQITAGGRHTIARLSDGTYYGWGYNFSGQLGFSPGEPIPDPAQQVIVLPRKLNLPDFATIEAGPNHDLALKSDGTVWAWGLNNQGQLGNGNSNGFRATPAPVNGLTGVAAVVAGGYYSLALKTDGTVWLWGGMRVNGEAAPPNRLAPVQIEGLTGVTAIAAGFSHALALRNDGTVWAWGTNFNGQLGDNTTTSRTTPVQVVGLTGVTAITGGTNHSVALKADGTVWAWGANNLSQLGTLSSDNMDRHTPVPVTALSGLRINSITAGGSDCNFALSSDRRVWAWGYGGYGQLADGVPTPPGAAVLVNGPTNVQVVAATFGHVVALTADNSIWTWGLNDYGQLGDGTTENQRTPEQITQLTGRVTIHYTTDGREPTEDDPAIDSGAAILVERTSVLKAKAFKFGWTPSATQTASYALLTNPANTTLQFSAAAFQAAEGAGRATLTITRAGDTDGATLVDYATIDNPAAVRCDDTTTLPGVAFARCDYATTIDTLTFAPGETQATISVPLIDDAHVEGNETVQLRLTNALGATLGTQSTATLTIADNDTTATPNPVFDSAFFVRQQYLDFLSREPDTSGYNAWLGVLARCSDVNNLDPNSPAAGCDRINVSNSFFGSQEFQLKGYFVFRFYRLELNRLPAYTEIIADMRGVTGQTGSEVFQKKAALANAFTQRTEFTTRFVSTDNSTYVTTLLSQYGLNAITTPDPANPDGTAKITLTAAELANRLNTNALTRAQVLRAIADSDQVFGIEFNRAFVAMQYYGYLRRTPETDGYNSWLNYLNAHPTDARTMVNGFMNSTEYRLRFGKAQ